jgi:hypothetical protein
MLQNGVPTQIRQPHVPGALAAASDRFEHPSSSREFDISTDTATLQLVGTDFKPTLRVLDDVDQKFRCGYRHPGARMGKRWLRWGAEHDAAVAAAYFGSARFPTITLTGDQFAIASWQPVG